MKNKIVIGIILGTLAGIIDVIPMIIQDLTWDANLGAFSMWVIVGFIISTSTLKIHAMLKGLLYSFLTLIPSAFLIAWNDVSALVPICIMTTILGSLLGLSIEKLSEKYSG